VIQTPESVKLNAKGKPLNFQSIGQEPLLWGYQAQNLKRVADNAFQLAKEDLKNMRTAWDRVDLIYKFLAGAALENLLKGIMIMDHPSLVGKRSLSNELRCHNIWTLHTEDCKLKQVDYRLKDVESRLEPHERDFLKRVEPYTWVGRYGVGTNETEYINDITAVTDPNAPSLDEFDKTFNEVFNKLLRILGEKIAAVYLAEDKKARDDWLATLEREYLERNKAAIDRLDSD
jgi:hypothetical protein